ncbi:MAG: efflux RND transporter periplasmic adaptor subunit [Myxococcota bacterium]
MKNVWANAVILFVVVGGATLVSVVMFSLRPEVQRQVREPSIPRVEVIVVKPQDKTAHVHAHGIVEQAKQISLMPQAQGRIVWQSDELVPGNRVQKGTVLARIDPSDYELAVEQSKSLVRNAEVELELERGRQTIAQEAWALLGGGADAEDAPLALRKPQLKAAEQSLAAAQASLRQAEINLQRTFLVAPFNSVILEESIDLGQVVGPSNTVVKLLGTDEVRVKVSLPMDQVSTVALPTGEDPGSRAYVEQRFSTGSVVRVGSVSQLLAQLDSATRTAQLLVAVPNPMEGPEGSIPLLPGAYVDVAIDGRVLSDVMAIPRTALDEGDRVWIVEQEGTLASRTVRVAWREAEDVAVTDGLESGNRVAVSPLAHPIEGMRVEAVSPGDALREVGPEE